MAEGILSTPSAGKSRLRNSSAILVIVAALYIAALSVLDFQQGTFAQLADAALALPVLVLASIAAYVLRFVRWHILLAFTGHLTPWGVGFIAYLAGFAFTASPGKVGELVRIRYFSRMGVPHAQVIACFVFERLLDIFALLILASFIVGKGAGFATVLSFVALVLAAVVVLARATHLRRWLQHRLRSAGFRCIARWTRLFLIGISATAQFMTPRRLCLAGIIALMAWGVQCLGFVAALNFLGIMLPWQLMLSVAPASMLIGAASMMPGGIGATEIAIVVLLRQFGADLDRAILSAIVMRLGSIWFATLIGFASLIWLERIFLTRRLPVQPS